MRIYLEKPYLSMTYLDTIELPKFTLITGVNGSGKTHLLKAINSGCILTNLTNEASKEIRYFDWKTLVPNQSLQADSNQMLTQHTQVINNFNNYLNKQLKPLVNLAKQYNFSSYLQDYPRMIATLGIDKITDEVGNSQLAVKVYEEIKRIVDIAINSAISNFGSNQKAKDFLRNSATYQGISLIDIDTNLLDNLPLGLEKPDIFQHSFAELFLAYRHLIQRNVLNREASKKGDIKARSLSDEDFEAQYGKPPWDFINETLESANLDFKIDCPDIYGSAPYTPVLKKKDNDVEIRFEHLSSGEQILMAFAFCLYYAGDTRQIVSYPRLLLFDEIDAPPETYDRLYYSRTSRFCSKGSSHNI